MTARHERIGPPSHGGEMTVGRHPLAPLSPEKLFGVADLDLAMPGARDAAPALGPLGAVIDRCLAKPREARLASADDLLARLQAIVDQPQGSAPRHDKADPLARTVSLLPHMATDDARQAEAIAAVRQVAETGHPGADKSVLGRSVRHIIQSRDLPAEQVAILLDIGSAALGLDTQRARVRAMLTDKTHEFVGREYAFERIEQFQERYPGGYLLIQAEPGLGKSALLAEYVRRTGCIAYFNSRSHGQVSASQFLTSVCAQLIVDYGLPYTAVPDGAEQNGAILHRLLQEASERRGDDEPLVIAIDALEAGASHRDCANILCLPSTLPRGVYIVATTRPVDIRMATESHRETLDLTEFPEDNRRDVERYLQRKAGQPRIRSWIDGQADLSPADFVHALAESSENNFMYLRYVVPGIAAGEYRDLTIDQLPRGLKAYYDDHWARMGMNQKPLPRLEITITYIMSEGQEPISRALLTGILTHNGFATDEFAVQAILDEWKPFLTCEDAEEGKRYGIYHASFRDFLSRKDIVQAAGVTIANINQLIAEYL